MRDLKTLSLTDGKDICNRAVDAAKALGLKVVVVVVDIGGCEVWLKKVWRSPFLEENTIKALKDASYSFPTTTFSYSPTSTS